MMDETNNGIKIEKSVPIPSGAGRAKSVAIVAALKTMEVGDSFLYNLDGRSIVAQRARMYRHAEAARVKIITRPEGDSFRVWKTGLTDDTQPPNPRQ